MLQTSVWAQRISVFLFLMGASVSAQAQAPPQFKADMQMSGGGNNMQVKMW